MADEQEQRPMMTFTRMPEGEVKACPQCGGPYHSPFIGEDGAEMCGKCAGGRARAVGAKMSVVMKPEGAS
jgi:hypothetical protein